MHQNTTHEKGNHVSTRIYGETSLNLTQNIEGIKD